MEDIRPKPKKKLNKNQMLFCELMANPESTIMSKGKMAEKIGVSRQTLYNWLGMKHINDYIKELVNYYTDNELANVWKSHIALCQLGDIKAIKLFYEMKQLYVPPNQAVDLQMKDANATINIITNIPRPEDCED